MLRWACWALVLAMSLGQAWAQDGRPVCPERPLRVGFFEFGILFTVDRANHRGFGMDRDIAFELEKRSGCRFEGELMSRARIWVEMQAGRLDMTLSVIKTPEREAMGWLYPYAIGYQEVLLAAAVPPEMREMAAFMANRELKFGVVRSFRHTPFYDAMIEELRAQGRVVEAVDELQLLNMVKHGSVGAVLSLPTVYARYFAPGEVGELVFPRRWEPGNRPTVGHLMLSKKTFDAVEAEKWRGLLADMQRDGTLLAIGMRYLGKEQARRLMIVPK